MESNISQDLSNYQKMLSAISTKETKIVDMAVKNISVIQDSRTSLQTYQGTEPQSADLNKEFVTESTLQDSSKDVFDNLLSSLLLNSANTNNTDKYTLQMLSSEKESTKNSTANTITFFTKPKDMQKADDFFTAIDNWEQTEQAKSLLKLTESTYATTTNTYGRIQNEKYFANIGTKLGQLDASRTNVASANLLLNTFDNLFELNEHPLTKRTNNLYESQVVSYEKYLKNLEARVDPYDKSQSWKKFFSEVFSKDTAKEIGNVFLDTATSFGLGIAKSLLPSFKFKFKDANELKDIKPFLMDYWDFKELGFVLYDDSELSQYGPWSYTHIAKDFRQRDDVEKEINSALLKNFLGIEPPQASKEDAKKESEAVANERLAMSLLFDQLIATNSLLGQHQFMLQIKEDRDFKEAILKNKTINNFYFRIKNIGIPETKRPTVNSIYGHSGNNFLVNTQASMEHKTEMTIVCDRNFDVLEYLIRLSGLGICETGKVIEENKDGFRTYNLSTVSSTNNKLTATLGILNGRDLAKEFYMENPDWDFSKEGSTAKNLGLEETNANIATVAYAKLPYFTFKNFKIVNLNYNFKFDSTKVDSALLEIKATITWTRLQVEWLSAKDYFEDTIETVTDS